MLNNVVLMGRLTGDPELKTTQNNISVTTFCIAVDRRFKSNEGAKLTDFINCVAWRNTADFITRYFKKGDMIAVTGEIQTRSYTDKDGNKRTAVEVVIDEASFCGGKSNNTVNNTEPTEEYEEIDINDDLPF